MPSARSKNHLSTPYSSRARRNSPSSHRGTKSLSKAIEILRLVAYHNNQGLPLSKISTKIGLHTTTAHRILKALVNEGFILKNPFTRLYHLGFELYLLGVKANQFLIRENIRPVLERIAEQSEDTVFLIVQSGIDALCVDRVEGAFPIRTLTHEIGTRVPLGIGAGSIALLASLPDAQAEKVIEANRKRYLEFNNRTAEDIRARLKKVRSQGYGMSGGDVMPEALSVGVPLMDAEGRAIAAVSVSAIQTRMTPARRKEMVALIKKEILTLGLFQPAEDSL